MAEEILIIKKKGGGKMVAKVRNKVSKGFSPNNYEKVLNPKDPNDLSILFEDLNLLYNSPIEKAFRNYHEKRNRGFPF